MPQILRLSRRRTGAAATSGAVNTKSATKFSISGNASDHQTCTVAENNPQAVMRVNCEAFKQWTAGRYIVYGKDYIRQQQIVKPVKNRQPQNENETEIEWAKGDEWRGEFKVGDKIQFSISEKAGTFKPAR